MQEQLYSCSNTSALLAAVYYVVYRYTGQAC